MVFRAIAASTNERTLITSILPKNVVCNHNVAVVVSKYLSDDPYLTCLYFAGITNSFVLDWFIRLQGANYLKFSAIYGIPVPDLDENDIAFRPIIDRAAKLICITPEFDDLAKEVGLGSHKNGVTDDAERQKLRAELDAIVAHLYGLTDEEFAYILTTFPLVSEEIKTVTLDKFRTYHDWIEQS